MIEFSEDARIKQELRRTCSQTHTSTQAIEACVEREYGFLH